MGPPPVPASRLSKQLPTGSAVASTRLSSAPARTIGGRSPFTSQSGARTAAGRLSLIGTKPNRGQTSEDSGQDTGDEDHSASPIPGDRKHTLSPKPLSPVLSRTSAAVSQDPPSTALSRSTASPVAQRSIAGNNAVNREVEDLKTKLRLMEKKRMEDRDKLKALEKIQAERDKFESIIQKLQAKYQPQQQEITELRKQLKESAAKFEEIENMQAEHDIVIEMATLDREMAEETAEVLKTELEALKLKAEELELEVEVLREENAELGGEMSPEEKASQGWLQMQRNNERLREALIRLRDMTQQQESELKDQIKSLEEDVRDLRGIKEHYDIVKEKLAQSEANIEDLRQQLENALGAEDMIEELTERNMSMKEQIEELKATVQDLESLKELNDELEINHVETEKEMQEDLDFKDSIISEQARRAAQQEETIEDMEYTLSRFRELVTTLQTDLEDMRASHSVTETEAEQLSSRSRAMMDLNMKLQASAAKTQAKTIELELRRLDAQEASDHLAIVQLFLPEAFSTDRDSVLAFLRFKRVGFKANLLHGFVRERISGQYPRGNEDDVFAACDVLDKLAWVSAMCDRFANAISHCSIEQFAKYEGAMYELEPVERALNAWIDGLRRDELKEKLCASELQRTIALMSHLAEVHISNSLEGYADDVHMRALIIQSHLENTAAALTAAKTMVQNIVPSKGDEDELAQHFVRKADAIISHTRSAKVIAGKAVRSLQDLKSRSLSLTPDTAEIFEQCETGAQELAAFSRHIGEDLFNLLYEEGRAEPFSYIEVQSIVHETTNAFFSTSESDLFSTFSLKLRNLTTLISDLASLTADLSQTVEFELSPAPWILRSQALRSTRTIPFDAEAELQRLKEDNHERARQIAMRDQTLEEASVKIQLLESRMRDATKKNERITELERRIEDAKKREAELTEAVESQNRELTNLEADRDRWKKIASDTKSISTVIPGSKAGQKQTVATAREMEALKSEIASLQAAVRYLREDNRRLRISDSNNRDWLSMPLLQPKSVAEQRRELVLAEGQDVLHELLNLVTSAEMYDLSTMPKNRLKWRPTKSTPQYHAAKQREEYESWNCWREAVLKKGKAIIPKVGSRALGGTGVNRRQPDVLARVELKLPGTEAEGKNRGGQVQIVEPAEFEGVRRGLGFA
jgi:dynactin 1